ncbi:MAG: type II toxin-antitoxin system RelE/ParE family toxin [Allosphingosinicella sp.]
MTKPVIRLESAQADEREVTAHYAREAGLDLALRFAEALKDAYCSIGNRPAIGSPRYGDILSIENLRSRAVRRFPYLVFYVEHEDHVDIWRILHAQRDIAAWLRGANFDCFR